MPDTQVTVYERDDAPGGLLRYGIPDFKLEKWVIDRRMKLMEEEGVVFNCNAEVGVNVSINDLLRNNHAIGSCRRINYSAGFKYSRKRIKWGCICNGFLKTTK